VRVPVETRIRVWGEIMDSQVPTGPPISGSRRARPERVRIRSRQIRPVAVRPAASRKASSARRRFPPGPVWQRMTTFFMLNKKNGPKRTVRSTPPITPGRPGRFPIDDEGQTARPLSGKQRDAVPVRPKPITADPEVPKPPHAENRRKRYNRNPETSPSPSRSRPSKGVRAGGREGEGRSSLPHRMGMD